MFVNLFHYFEPIYHFTNFESAIKILATKRLRFGKMCRMNDPNESFRPLFIQSQQVTEDAYDQLERLRGELEHYQQISFACDSRKLCGFQLQNMWGNYADSGNGVCLVFDKGFVIEELNGQNYGKIRYSKNYVPAIIMPHILENTFVKRYVKSQMRSIFFRKSIEWQWEQEFRIVQRFESTEDNYLDLKSRWDKALKCVLFVYAQDVSKDLNVFAASSVIALSKLVPKDCLLLQKAKDLDGNDVLYDKEGNVKWGCKIDAEDIDV